MYPTCVEASSPVEVEKKPFARLKEEMSNLTGNSKSKAEKLRKKEAKPAKKLTKSKSQEQQPQSTPSFGTSVSLIILTAYIASYCCRDDDDDEIFYGIKTMRRRKWESDIN